MTESPGRFAILDQLLADGVRYMFGNPGTVEQGFLDALADRPDLEYVLSLQETIAVAIADGYARASGEPAVVQLHSGVGLGNGIGMLYQAMRGHAPLVVLVGESGVRYDAMDAQMAADLVSIAKPVTKWAGRVLDPSSLLRMLRRAVKIAATPPRGPVLLALPMDVLDAMTSEDVLPTSVPATRTIPEAALVEQAVSMLKGCQNPMIIMGDGVAHAGAQAELSRLAEVWGAEVWGADSSEVNIGADHPAFRGLLGHMFGDHSRPITSKADGVLICGTYVFPEVFPALSDVFAPGAPVVHIDLNAYEIGKSFPVDLGLVSDPKPTLAAVADGLERSMGTRERDAAGRRVEAARSAKAEQTEAMLADDAKHRDDVPMHPSRFMSELAGALPSDTIVFDEALTVSPEVVQYLPPNEPGRYFQTRGGSLGVGIPGAIGIKLARPKSTVVGFTGDGGSMYTIQALWTAAHHNVGAKFVVCNNGSYQLLKLNLQQYWKERGLPERGFPSSFDLGEPALRFDLLAESMGVPATRVETPGEIGPAIERALSSSGPYLLDVVLNGDLPGHERRMKTGPS